MTSDIDAILDDLLALWYRYAEGEAVSRGYGSTSSMFRDTRSAWSPYDRDNGVVEEQAKKDVARAVGVALMRVPNDPHLWRTVLMQDAHNIALGYAVWSSNRLPAGEELDVLRLEARNRLLVELRIQGCVG